MDDVMRCIISYHETRQFVQVVSTLIIHETSQWSFLRVIQKSMSPLDRSILVKRCILDSSLLNFIFDVVQDSETKGIRHVSLITFLNSTMVDFVQTKEQITENDLTIIVPRVLPFLKSEEINLQASVVMVINQLSSKCAFDDQLLCLVLEKIALNLNERNRSFMIPAMIVLVHLQDSKIRLPHQVIDAIRDIDGVLDDLVAFTEKFDGEKFLQILLSSCLSSCFQNQETKNLDFLKRIIKQVSIGSLSDFLSQLLLLKIKEFDSDFASIVFENIYEVIPQALNSALSSYFSNLGEAEKENDVIFKLTQKSLEDTLSEPLICSGTSLFLSLENPHSHIRRMAVKKLANTLKKKDDALFNDEEVKQLLLNRLKDDEDDVVRAVLKISNLDALIPYKELMDVLCNIIWSTSKPKFIIAALKSLIKYYRFECDPHVDQAVLHICYCFVFMSNGTANISENLIDSLRKYQPKFLSFLHDSHVHKGEETNHVTCNLRILKSFSSKFYFSNI